MKKVFIFLTIIFLMISCDSTEDDVNNDNKEIIITDGESTVINNPSENDKPNSTTPNDSLFIMIGKIMNYNSYQVDVNGKVEAKKGFIKNNQDLTNLIIKNGKDNYYYSLSNSIIKSEHTAFFRDNKVVYKMNNEDNNFVNLNEYIERFKVIPMKNVFGYILNNESILSSSLIDNQDGLYHLKYVLDPVKAMTLIVKQTKEFGDLKELPKFNSVEIIVAMKEDYTPVSISTVSSYDISISILGDFHCVQSVKYEYSKFNEEIDIPNIEEYNELYK